MTPSNPDNSQPLIYRIADALGVFHLVAPVNHTHSQAEIDGLAAALAGKQNILNFDTTPTAGSTNPVTSGGVKTALNGKANANHGHESIGGTGSAQDASVECIQDIVKISAEGEVIIEIQGQTINLTVDNYDNLVRALANPDSTPTANSDNLVTSGGVKTALNGKANANHGHESIGGTGSAQDASVECIQDIVKISAEGEVIIEIQGQTINLTVDNYDNLVRALANPDSTPTANSDNLVTSGGVKAAIDALLTNYIPIHQVAAILPKTTGHESEQELQNWLGDGKMALVLQTARPVKVSIEATGVDDAPDGTWSGSTDISFDLGQGIRTVKNIYALMDAQLQNDYPGERIGTIINWKIRVYAKDTVQADTVCLINFYNPTSAE